MILATNPINGEPKVYCNRNGYGIHEIIYLFAHGKNTFGIIPKITHISVHSKNPRNNNINEPYIIKN